MNTLTEPQRHARAVVDGWLEAFRAVAQAYPGSTYNFGQAGPSIDIPLNATTGLTFGVCDTMIGANVYDIIGDEWDMTHLNIETPLSSESEDGEAIAAAILESIRAWRDDYVERVQVVAQESLGELETAIAALQAHIESLPESDPVVGPLSEALAIMIDAYGGQS